MLGTVTVPSRLSPAALARFRVCNRQFLLVDVERVPRREQPNPLLAQGNAIHAALERFFGLRPEDRTPPVEVLQQALRSQWRTFWKSEALGNADTEIEFGRKALNILGGFAERFDTTAEPLAREQWVQMTLPNGIELFGKVDRIDPFEDGLDLIDYKTGKRQLDADDLSGRARRSGVRARGRGDLRAPGASRPLPLPRQRPADRLVARARRPRGTRRQAHRAHRRDPLIRVSRVPRRALPLVPRSPPLHRPRPRRTRRACDPGRTLRSDGGWISSDSVSRDLCTAVP